MEEHRVVNDFAQEISSAPRWVGKSIESQPPHLYIHMWKY